jgi:hypothetical protein
MAYLVLGGGVAFSIGSYIDKVDCDVVPMNACHLLLGRPWQFDLNATHEGRSNHYSFIHRGVKHVLKPIHDSAIKSMVFSAVKNKKEPCQINPKQRTVLFQGREDDMPKKLNVLSVDVLPVIEEHDSNIGEELVSSNAGARHRKKMKPKQTIYVGSLQVEIDPS